MAAQLDALLATGVALDSPDFAARLDALSPVGATRQLYELPTRRNIGTVGDDLGQFTCSAAAGGSRARPADAASLPSDGPCVYMAGNSLGLLPKKARTLINEEMDVWGSRSAPLSHWPFFSLADIAPHSAVMGHFDHPHSRPWKDIDDHVTPALAALVGAESPSEVACTSTLTSNLHNLFVSFFRPEGNRTKILCEAKAFPSDQVRSFLPLADTSRKLML